MIAYTPFLAVLALHAVYGLAVSLSAPRRWAKTAAMLAFVGSVIEVVANVFAGFPSATAFDAPLVAFLVGAVLVLGSGIPASLRLASKAASLDGGDRLVWLATATPLLAALASAVVFGSLLSG